ncbi:maltooligosyltrehalose trehalohydrolase [Halopseudomonas sabulinigri]|uniref:Malto-oligosyltrehalose trehalohydrolase n=1 Tax=Halopseudomonas sabulinigri TaxID=472181 RepID=A0A1H1PBR0_9GAMM|nr:malto-oligosyltrehalose trehalohydrolase [Halopseudomonas sabulinigri]SDS08520.1 maltooligosyltrehalose trehalohydrolase [Halopseudomonas sabulinigri]
MFGLRSSHGALLLDPCHTRFRLWAPDANRVEVRIVDGGLYPLQRQDEGWFEATVAVGAGVEYCYRIDGRLEVPDPASRQQRKGPQSPSVVVDPDRYLWDTAHWQGRPWAETVIYELHVGALGGFKQVESWLPHLRELGVTAIELMPLNEVPGGRNWGYDGVLPYAPQSSYGTPDELRHLIDRAHALGQMVFIDVVYNHFGPDGNYLGEYASDFFRTDIPTPWGAAIDFRKRPVRDFFVENALMWVHEFRVDGLRLDAVHAINDISLLEELSERVQDSLPEGRQVHLVLENEGNDAPLLEQRYRAQWNDDGHNVLHHLLTGESDSYYADFAKDSTDKLAQCLQEGFVYQGQRNRHGRERGKPSGHLDATCFVLFLQNHDQIGNRALGERLINLTSEAQLKAAIALLLLSPMVPLLFMGEEWGCTQPFLFFTDHHGELAAAVREGRRSEFSEFAAFNDEQQREKIPDPNAASTFTHSRPNLAEVNEPTHRAWLEYYRHLLSLRHGHLTPRLQGARSLGVEVLGPKAVSARWSLADGAVWRIDLNLSTQACELLPLQSTAEVIFAVGIALDDSRNHRLPGCSALISMEKKL